MSPWYFQASFESIGLLVQEKKFRTILAISDLQVNALILPTKFQVNWPFGSRKEVQNRFSSRKPWLPSWILDLNDFSSFWSTVQVAPIFPSKFGVSWPFGSREVQNRFSRWRTWWPSWILDLNDLSYFWSTSHPIASYQVKSIGLLVQEKKQKTDFQDGGHGSHLGFLIGTILATFDLQVTLMLPTKFQVNWPFSSGWEATSKFHGEFMSPALLLIEVLKMGKLTRGPLVLYHLTKYWSRKLYSNKK